MADKTFKTGPVDPTKPLELDDGTPVTAVEVRGNEVLVALPQGKDWQRSARPGTKIVPSWLYDLSSGIWSGSDEREGLVLRNVSFLNDEPSDVAATLTARAAEYGPFDTKSASIQRLKSEFRAMPKWSEMTGAMQEALDLIATKIGRIGFGNPAHQDSWHDIVGYAKLVDDALSDEPKTTS